MAIAQLVYRFEESGCDQKSTSPSEDKRPRDTQIQEDERQDVQHETGEQSHSLTRTASRGSRRSTPSLSSLRHSTSSVEVECPSTPDMCTSSYSGSFDEAFPRTPDSMCSDRVSAVQSSTTTPWDENACCRTGSHQNQPKDDCGILLEAVQMTPPDYRRSLSAISDTGLEMARPIRKYALSPNLTNAYDKILPSPPSLASLDFEPHQLVKSSSDPNLSLRASLAASPVDLAIQRKIDKRRAYHDNNRSRTNLQLAASKLPPLPELSAFTCATKEQLPRVGDALRADSSAKTTPKSTGARVKQMPSAVVHSWKSYFFAKRTLKR